jgi:hypothetical protein
MKYYGILAFILGMLLTGCNFTTGSMELKGKVIDESTKAPIPNLLVKIEALNQANSNNAKIYAGEFTTDSAGCFTYTLKKVKNVVLYNFHIEGYPEYDRSDKILGLADLDTYGKYLSLEAKRIVDFTMKINRVSKTPLLDTLIVSWRTNGVDGETLYPFVIRNYRINSEKGLIWIGGDVKSEIKTKVYADKNTVVHWQLYRNSRHRDIIDTIFCNRTSANSVTLTY